MAVSHINRAGQRDGVTHYSLRDSSSKEQDADQILLLTAVLQDPNGEWKTLSKDRVAEAIRKDNAVNVRLWLTKNRHGIEGNIYCRLDWASGGRFIELLRDD
jgi:hypothetical protein